jgi:oxygen-independent coproporphyrinogen-3 oxidase
MRTWPSLASMSTTPTLAERVCDFAVDLDAQAGATDFAAELDALDALCASGIVRRHGRRIMVTEKGCPFVRLVAAVFDAYLPRNHQRHSVAV